jgi:Glycosyl transferase family 2
MALRAKNILDGLVALPLFAWLALRDRRAGWQLRCVQDRTGRIGPSDIILVTCLRNERPRLPAFTDYYRRLGVGHFLVIDNDSDDGLMDWAAAQPDMSVWHTAASYRASAFGMLWVNDLLRRHGRDRWCVVVDPDEFLVYPMMETRSLRALAQFLEDDLRQCLHALLVDAYGDRPLEETVLAEGDDPFAVCPFFDRDGYLQREGWANGTWVQGGPRLRAHFPDQPKHAPALNKMPFVRWRGYYHYNRSTHDAWPRRLNRAHAQDMVSTTGALFHFKLVAALRDKAAEEAERNQHYAGGREYARYRGGGGEFLADGLSVRYAGPAQLVELGLMSPGRWF